eukprot:scaffold627_cov125-Cylindrotheca_fusiformis.AAC.6
MAVYRPPGSAAPTPAPAGNSNSAYNPSYSSTPAGASTPSYGYGSSPAPATSGYSNYSSSNNANAYGSSTSGYNSNAASSKPDFSQALNVPPPVQQQTYAPTAPSNYSQATATAVPSYGGQPTNYGIQPPQQQAVSYGRPASRAPNDFAAGATGGSSYVSTDGRVQSAVYTSGPSGHLISEGNPTQCHKVDYEIKGHEMQLVEIELDPQETVIAEAGAMMFLDEGIDFKTKFGDGSEPKQTFFKKLMSAGGRLLTGESLFITHFTNQGNSKARVAFAAPFPGSIVPINMASFGNKLICQKDAFLCAAKGTSLKMHFHKKLGSGLVGGEGFILQRLQGDGMAFIHAGGCIIKRELRGEKLRLDTGCLVAFTEGINFDVQMAPGLKTMFFGGEGLFLATLQGTGTVWLQSLPFSRMADRIVQHAPSIGGRRQGEGSALTGGFGDMIDGDNQGLGSLIGRF